MGDFRKLKVWRRAHKLTLAVYKATRTFPDSEKYGLTSQIRRSSASIPTNIAEGCGRNTDGELARFLNIALGSANELDYQLLLARDLGLLTKSTHKRLSNSGTEVRSMLATLVRQLQTDS